MLENRLKITGTWMEKKNCQMHGQDSQDLFYQRKGHRKDFHGPGKTDKKTNDRKARQVMARNVVTSVRRIKT